MSLKRFREPTSNSTKTNPNTNLNSPSGGGSGRILYEAVVKDFFSNPVVDLAINPTNDPAMTYGESLLKGINSVSNTDLISKMPRRSITAVVVSDGEAWSKPSPEIFYPLFPHMSMPVKPGEKIWVIYETLQREKSRRGYWVSRITADIKVDDPNYTHMDREFLYSHVPTENTSAISAATGETDFDQEDVFGFPAGGNGNSSKNTLPGENSYDQIVASSTAYITQFSGEPVPRFSPLLGDFTIEGSHNTLVNLGQDRPSLVQPSEVQDLSDRDWGRGTIDIVAGRGQTDETKISDVEIEKRGEALYSYFEGDKFPSFEGESANDTEGHPDFENDLSRVYVSMKTDGDSNFDLNFTDSSAPQVEATPYIIAKSTEIRLVARDGGSIRMIKEGSAQAEICITSDGTIIIEGTNSARSAQKVIRGEDLAAAMAAFSAEIARVMPITFGNMGGTIVDGGIAAACSTLATDVNNALSEEVFIK
jgi:hypothetical protein